MANNPKSSPPEDWSKSFHKFIRSRIKNGEFVCSIEELYGFIRSLLLSHEQKRNTELKSQVNKLPVAILAPGIGNDWIKRTDVLELLEQ